MKQKIVLSIGVILFSVFQLMAQCRLVRVETSDTSETHYLSYDKLGRLSAYKFKLLEGGKINTFEHQFAYNYKDKIVNSQALYNDTVIYIRNYIYVGDTMRRVYTVWSKDSTLGTGQLFYNEKGQVNHFLSKNTKGDTFSIDYEYAPKDWLKRMVQKSNVPEMNFIIENTWDTNQTVIDEPTRIFFAGYAASPMNSRIIPIEPLSVKGNQKTYTQYKIDKEGKPVKEYEGEVFDDKANAEGLWLENKWRNSQDNKIITYRAFYEGCKN